LKYASFNPGRTGMTKATAANCVWDGEEEEWREERKRPREREREREISRCKQRFRETTTSTTIIVTTSLYHGHLLLFLRPQEKHGYYRPPILPLGKDIPP
jgi:hypothetical protein